MKQWNYVKQTVKLGYVIHFFRENYEAVKLCEAQVETVGLRRAWHRQNSMLLFFPRIQWHSSAQIYRSTDHRCNGPMAWLRSFPFTLDGDRGDKTKSWNGLKPWPWVTSCNNHPTYPTFYGTSDMIVPYCIIKLRLNSYTYVLSLTHPENTWDRKVNPWTLSLSFLGSLGWRYHLVI